MKKSIDRPLDDKEFAAASMLVRFRKKIGEAGHARRNGNEGAASRLMEEAEAILRDGDIKTALRLMEEAIRDDESPTERNKA